MLLGHVSNTGSTLAGQQGVRERTLTSVLVTPDPLTAHLAWCTHRGLAVGTLAQRQHHLRRLQGWLTGQGLSLLDPGPDGLRTWQTTLTTGAAGRRSAVGHARGFYQWAVDVDLADPKLLRHLVSPKQPRRLPRPIDGGDLDRALDNAPDRLRPWLLLAAFAGLRAHEVAPLRAEDLALTVAHAATVRVEGKGGKERVIPLGPAVVAELRGCGLPRRGWLFPGQDRQRQPTGLPVTASQVSHLGSRYLHESGSPSTFHSLRHRFGTDAYAASCDLRLVQELLGHASPVTTAIYAALVPGRAAQVTAAIASQRLQRT